MRNQPSAPRAISPFRCLRAVLLILALAAPLLSSTPIAFAQTGPDKSPHLFLPLVKGGGGSSVQAPAWLVDVNHYRDLADLPPVSENTEWSAGGAAHARYAVKNDVLSHSEEPGNPWYTPEGQAAAGSSNLVASSDANASDRFAIDSWMQAPFHAIGILNPALRTVGFGSFRAADGGLQMAAGLDVLRGQVQDNPWVTYPVYWPKDGAQVPLTQYWGEYPEPLSSCPGYQAPAGLPVILQLGSGGLVPQVEAHSFTSGGKALEHCIFNETSYVNSDPAAQDLGRSLLGSHDAVVLIPRQPLTPGSRYTVSMTVSGQQYTWSFTVRSGTSQP